MAGFGGAAASGNINEGSAAWFIVAGRQQVTTGQNWDGRISNFYFSKTMLGLAEARRITAQPVAYLSGLGR